MPRERSSRNDILLCSSARCNHHSRTSYYHYYARSGRDALVVFGSHPDAHVTRFERVVLRMWDRNKERQNTEDEYHQPHYKQYLHESLRPTGVGCIQD
jgi:hypothetical protein